MCPLLVASGLGDLLLGSEGISEAVFVGHGEISIMEGGSLLFDDFWDEWGGDEGGVSIVLLFVVDMVEKVVW